MKRTYHLSQDVLPASVCQDIVERASRLEIVDATVGFGTSDQKIRTSELRWMQAADIRFRDISDFVFKCFTEANTKSFNLDIGWHFPMQFTTYYGSNGGHYDWHMDTYLPSPTSQDRKLTFILQLSDPADYEGGFLELQCAPDWNPDLFKKRGQVLVFPSIIPHRLTPVTSGERRVLVAWLDGPPWK